MGNNIIFHTGIEQRSEKWNLLRCGKFTSSKIENLCKPKGLGQSGESYIYSVLAEILTGKKRETPQTFSMQWGTMYEPIARECLIDVYKNELHINLNIQEVAFIENTLYKNCGASPDGVEFNIFEGFEIKCPEDQANHIKYMEFDNQFDLKKNKPEYYWQIMFCMLMSDFKKWNFVSFHPDFQQNLMLFVLPVIWNDSDIDFLKNRINQANEILALKLKRFGIDL